MSNGGLAAGEDQPGVTLERNLSVERPVLKREVTGAPSPMARFALKVFKRATTAASLRSPGWPLSSSGTFMSTRRGRETAASACR